MFSLKGFSGSATDQVFARVRRGGARAGDEGEAASFIGGGL